MIIKKSIIKNNMKTIIQFLQRKEVETWAWEATNAFILIVIASIAEVDAIWVVPAIALLNQITKYINVKYLK